MDIMSDIDTNFTIDFWTQVFKKLGITFNMSPTDHTQSDGQTKPFNHE